MSQIQVIKICDGLGTKVLHEYKPANDQPCDPVAGIRRARQASRAKRALGWNGLLANWTCRVIQKDQASSIQFRYLRVN